MSIIGFCAVAGAVMLASCLQASIGFGIGMLAAPVIALVDPGRGALLPARAGRHQRLGARGAFDAAP
jgi:hypothetical protein